VADSSSLKVVYFVVATFVIGGKGEGGGQAASSRDFLHSHLHGELFSHLEDEMGLCDEANREWEAGRSLCIW
jgi:hypothetical protein